MTLLGGLAIGSLMASGLAVANVANAAESEDADARQTAGLERLEAYASARPERFGLFWLDGAGRRVIVQVTDRASAQDRAAAWEALGDMATVEFEPVSNSRFDLDEAHEVLNDLIRAHDPHVAGIRGVSQNIGENVITVRVTPEEMDQTRAFIRQLVGSSLVRFEPGGYDQHATCDSRTSCWHDPIRGGAGCSEQGGQRHHDVPDHSFGGVGPNSYYDGSYSDLGILYMGDIQGMSGHPI